MRDKLFKKNIYYSSCKMDVLYENLDNYNEEQTIAELQAENKELKEKLEEYASITEKLLKDIDNVTSEHKKLQLNYSSLLKTARAEIERKSQIITNLNLEKDKLFLKFYHKRNQSPASLKQQKSQNFGDDANVYNEKATVEEIQSSRKSSPCVESWRKEPDFYISKDATVSSNKDINNRLLNMANNCQRLVDPRIEKRIDIKENLIQPRKSDVKDNTTQLRMDQKNDTKENITQPIIEKKSYTKENVTQPSIERKSDTKESISKPSIEKKSETKENKTLPSIEKKSDTKDKDIQPSIERLCDIKENITKTKSRIEKKSVNENIIQPKKEDDVNKRRALIRNRRKSMPASCLQLESISDDDDNTSSWILEDKSRNYLYRRNKDVYFSSKPSSRISGTSSFEENVSRYHEPVYNAHRSRLSKYDHDKIDRHRDRDKSSHRNKRYSPDRFRAGRDNYHYRFERDRHRGLETTIDKYYWEKHRGPHDNNERSQENRRVLRSHVKYPMKHKIQHTYSETDSKRLKIDPKYRQQEDDQRLQDERDYLDKKYAEQFNNPQLLSCESPDYCCPDVATEVMKEIKFTSTSLEQLEDPRISHEKYITKNNNGKVVISTLKGRDVELIPVKYDFIINPVSMPEALVRRPSQEVLHTLKQIHMQVESPVMTEALVHRPSQEVVSTVKQMHRQIETPIADISMESGEIYDIEGQFDKHANVVSDDSKIPKSHRKEISVKISDKPQDIEKSLQNRNSYKIPKLKRTEDDKLAYKDTKEKTSLIKKVVKNIPETKLSTEKSVHEKTSCKLDNICDSVLVQSDVPLLNSSNVNDKQKYIHFKGVVEDDLELSDDDVEQVNHIHKEKNGNLPLPKNKTESLDNFNIDLVKSLTPGFLKYDNSKNTKESISKENVDNIPLLSNKTEDLEIFNIDAVKNNTPILGLIAANIKYDRSKNVSKETILKKATTDLGNEKATDDCKKTRSKKKPKHKEIDEIKETKTISEKPTRKKSKVNETKTKVVKNKFSELFDDSSSLICPEDLGLTTVPASDAKLLDKCVPFFEDAQDAVDLVSVKDRNPILKSNSDINKHSASENKTSIQTSTIVELADKINSEKPAIDQDVIKTIYKNLEPDTTQKENDVIKTIVISSGVQPQVNIAVDNQELASSTEPGLIKAVNKEALKALATSTPYKVWQTSGDQAPTKDTVQDTFCESNKSQTVNNETTPALNNSDNKTLDSQSDDTAPDVRIFVKRRRRKVITK